MHWFIITLKKYATFSGRAQRAEYWYATLIFVAISFVLGLIDGAMGAPDSVGVLSAIFALGTLLPSLAVSVRRLHDVNRRGWWLLLAFTVVGLIPLIIWSAQDSDSGSNRFGPNPKRLETGGAAFE